MKKMSFHIVLVTTLILQINYAVICQVSRGNNSFLEAKFDHVLNNTRLNIEVLATTEEESVSHCIISCFLFKKTCQTINYHAATRQCELLNGSLVNTNESKFIEEKLGWKHYDYYKNETV